MRLIRSTLVLLAVLSVLQGVAAFAAEPMPIPANHVRVHYFRPDGIYTGWTVFAFGNTTEDQGNFPSGPVTVTGMDSFGAFFDVGITAGATDVGIIVHKGDLKDPGPDEHVNPWRRAMSFIRFSAY